MTSPLPRWPHIPGRTDQPDYAWLTAISDDSATRVRLAVSLIQNDFHWEAHELLEPVWHALPPQSASRDMIRAVIQLANALLKIEMRRPSAAARLLDEVVVILRGIRAFKADACCGLDPATLLIKVEAAAAEMKAGRPAPASDLKAWCAAQALTAFDVAPSHNMKKNA